MNKQDLINEIRECRFGVNESITDIDELWVWINQNYISKEEISGLVDEQKIVGNINDCCIANLNELKKEIKKL